MITIRKASRADAKCLDRLYTELEQDAVDYQPEHFVISSRTRLTADMFDSDTQTMLVAEDDGAVIGFAHLMLIKAKDIPCLKPQTALYLQDLVVTADYRSKGIGTMLLSAAKEYGREKDADFFRTQVFPQNTDGLRFYERNGFAEKMKTIECPLI